MSDLGYWLAILWLWLLLGFHAYEEHSEGNDKLEIFIALIFPMIYSLFIIQEVWRTAKKGLSNDDT